MFCKMLCKPRVHNGIYSIHCKRCSRNMGNEHPFIPRGFGLKVLYKSMIPTWFQRAMFLFLSCFVSCFEGLIFLQFQKICFLHVFIMFFVTFHIGFLQVFNMFLKVSVHVLFMFLSCFSKVHFLALYNKFLQFFLLCFQ